MTNTIDNYKHSTDYETFIHRANRSADTSRPDCHGSIIQNFIRVESGDTSWVKYHGSFEKQLQKLKIYMHKAMDKYLKMKKIPHENLERLNALNTEIDRAYSSTQLMAIIHESIALTQCLKKT